MIIKESNRQYNFIDKLYRIILLISKLVAIYLTLSMAWSFSIILVVVILVVFFWLYNMQNLTDLYRTDLPITPLGKLREGVRKVQGQVKVKETIRAPLDGRVCVGYAYNVYDITEEGQEEYSLHDSKTVCEDFILLADDHRVDVEAHSIDFIFLSEDVEKIINNQKHIQKTLCANDNIIVVADAVMQSDNTYKLKQPKNSHAVTVMKSEDMPFFNTMRKKPKRLLDLGVFISAILISIILMANITGNLETQTVFFWDLNQVLFGGLIQIFPHEIELSFKIPSFLLSLIQVNFLFSAILTTVGSYVIFYVLSKIKNILMKHGFNILHYIISVLAIVIFNAGVFSFLSLIVLFIFSFDVLSIKLLIIWCVVFIAGIINFIFFNLTNRFG